MSRGSLLYTVSLGLYVADPRSYTVFIDELRSTVAKAGYRVSKFFTSSLIAASEGVLLKLYPSRADVEELWRSGGLRVEVTVMGSDPVRVLEVVDTVAGIARRSGIRIEILG